MWGVYVVDEDGVVGNFHCLNAPLYWSDRTGGLSESHAVNF